MEYTFSRMIYSQHEQQNDIHNEEKNIESNLTNQKNFHEKDKIDKRYSKPGLVIISEFVSSARPMQGGIIVNPWKIDEVSKFIINFIFYKHILFIFFIFFFIFLFVCLFIGFWKYFTMFNNV